MRPDINQLLITLRGGKGNHVPLAELGVHPLIKEQITGRPILTLEDDVEFWHKAGYDYIKLQPAAEFNPAGIGAGNNIMMYREGTLSRKWASENSGVITSPEEFERYIFPSSADFDYSGFERIKKILPEGMGVIGQYGDIFTMTWEMMGFENFSFAMYENPDLVIELNNKLGALIYSMFEYFVESEVVDAVWYSDDIAYTNGLLVSPAILDVVFFPWLKKIGELCRKYNKPFIYHTDGILYDIMDKIIDCGVNALHPIEPKAMSIKEVKERYGTKLCLMGNVDVDMLSRGRPEEIKRYVRKNIEEIGYNGGYCVGSGNSVPEYVDINNYRAMIEEVVSG
jgi:uroporphyrinogen decarboxylase